MTRQDLAPIGLRRLATAATVIATGVALSGLPRDELPIPWMLAFTIPGAVLGGWSRHTRSPWLRALIAVALQASACWGALELVGPMTRPAALACTILPPLAFATTRSHDTDPSLALFLSFCVMLVAVMLGGASLPLLTGYAAAAFLTLHVTTLLHGFRASAPRKVAPRLRAADVSATSTLTLSCLLCIFAIDRTLTYLPSPTKGDEAAARGASDGGGAKLDVGLDDTFAFDGPGGALSELRGERLVRVESAEGELASGMYLRCGFFTLPGIDRWAIGPLKLGAQSEEDGHVFRRPRRGAAVKTLGIDRYAGAAKFVFLPPHTTALRGLEELAVDPLREWARPLTPNAESYEASWQRLPAPPAGARIDRRRHALQLLSLPSRMELGPYEELLDSWGVGREPTQAMAAIAAGLSRRCRYERSTPTGPFAHELENFLFADRDRHGYCMHFASAAALMLRMRGVPARVAVGLYGGQADNGRADVRFYGSQHAHAWVEVPFQGRGYEIFDPTPPSARGRGFVSQDEAAATSGQAISLEPPLYEQASRAIAGLVAAPWVWSIALAAVLLLAAAPRRAPKRPAPPKASIAPKARRALQRLMRALARAGHRRSYGQTLELFADELDGRDRLDPAVRAAFLAYQEVRFGGRAFDQARSLAMEQGIRAAADMRGPDGA